jgi:hypothetical protein
LVLRRAPAVAVLDAHRWEPLRIGDQGPGPRNPDADCLILVRRIVFTTLAGIGSAAGFIAVRRWHQRWGATDPEIAAQMPGDNLLKSAAFQATRAITISATPPEVFPWLLQVGFGRAGFYSYDLLDNLGRPSAREILPQFQSARVGDVAAPMAKPSNEKNSFRISLLDPPTSLVWSKRDSTWAWCLTPTEDNSTRLVTRLRARYELTPFLPVTLLLMELGDYPMMRKMLLGLRQRAEATARASAAPPTSNPTTAAN